MYKNRNCELICLWRGAHPLRCLSKESLTPKQQQTHHLLGIRTCPQGLATYTASKNFVLTWNDTASYGSIYGFTSPIVPSKPKSLLGSSFCHTSASFSKKKKGNPLSSVTFRFGAVRMANLVVDSVSYVALAMTGVSVGASDPFL